MKPSVMVVCPFDRDVMYDEAWLERQIASLEAITNGPAFGKGETSIQNDDIIKIVQALKYALYYKYDG